MSSASPAVEPAAANLAYVEEVFEQFRRDPASVAPEWRAWFAAQSNGDAWPDGPLGPVTAPRSLFHPAPVTAAPAESDVAVEDAAVTGFQDRVGQLIRNYRHRGHSLAKIDPLGLVGWEPEELTLAYFHFSEEELDRSVSCKTFQNGRRMPLRELYERLRATYCGSIGVEYMHINGIKMRRWLQAHLEPVENRTQLARGDQLRIFRRLTDATLFEEFIRKKFIGAKSFSLEGCETLIPLLDLAIEKAAQQGVAEIVLGMAHRGRLNVLANVMGKSPRQIFREFADKDPDLYTGRGDVKYHLGHSNDWTSQAGRRVHLSLCFNPSHLEYVNPVVLGRVRAKQDRVGDRRRTTCMGLLIHGDAAFAGEGIVQETLNLSELEGYRTGGTLHIVVNNQIGFTTGPRQGRSTAYATDVAKMLQSPIFHVNGEDPEAVAQVVQIAMEFRAEFKRDVFIDMYGYRRLGHNETDEPAFTQPVLYRTISQRKAVREGYLDHLLRLGGVTREEADQIAVEAREKLERELNAGLSDAYQPPKEKMLGIWSRSAFTGGRDHEVPDPDTGVPVERLAALLRQQSGLPDGFKPHPKIARLLEDRRRMADGAQPLDWAAAEALAFASLLTDGIHLRLSGQDVERGTFSHRHAVLHDFHGDQTFTPLQHLAPGQAPFDIYNSPLSEAGVLGFDYGYSLDCPDGLVMWEAQFGDFANCAQVIIDQFISSSEDKWRRLSGLVLLLPHGFEGQGPEHSSARLERFLALAAEDNLQVCYPTTPAQMFHLLRRQVLRPWRKPLIVMTPKSLLRHPAAVSSLDELSRGIYQRVLGDPTADPAAVKRVLLCSGKVHYELLAEREKRKRADVALLRVEQLYPVPNAALEAALRPFADGTPVTWVQEEPANMGALRQMRAVFGDRLLGRFPLGYVSRPASASPATGSANSHKKEQAKLLAEAFTRTA
jgi:2-oxoglutarate dehydrogenase E1 component